MNGSAEKVGLNIVYLEEMVWAYHKTQCVMYPGNVQRSDNNQSVVSSAPVVSRCFPGGYNVKLYISRGRLAWWLLAFLHSGNTKIMSLSLHIIIENHMLILWLCLQIAREGKKMYITQGTWDVMQFSGYDEETKTVFYIATNGDPRKRHLFQ